VGGGGVGLVCHTAEGEGEEGEGGVVLAAKPSSRDGSEQRSWWRQCALMMEAGAQAMWRGSD
jgi:hypothetical protein